MLRKVQALFSAEASVSASCGGGDVERGGGDEGGVVPSPTKLPVSKRSELVMLLASLNLAMKLALAGLAVPMNPPEPAAGRLMLILDVPMTVKSGQVAEPVHFTVDVETVPKLFALVQYESCPMTGAELVPIPK